MTLRELLWGPSRYVASTPWHPAWAVVATVFIVLGAQLVPAILFQLAAWLDALPMSPLHHAGPESPAWVLMLWLALTQAAAIVLVIIAAHLFGGRPRDVLRLAGNGIGSGTLLHAVLLMAIVLGSYNALVYLFRPAEMLEDLRLYAGFIRSDAWLLAGLAIGVGAPLMEEFVFRGFLQSALAKSRLGFWPAAVLGTALWTVLHWGYSWVGLTEVFLIGVYFSWLLWKTGSLLPPLLCHALYNSLLVLVLRFAPVPV